MPFDDNDLKRLKMTLRCSDALTSAPIYDGNNNHELKALLARLLDAENVIMVHGEDGCTACQKWRLSCGLPKNKSV